jgi:CO/xanthine dehydrogenase Mo-binding subunit
MGEIINPQGARLQIEGSIIMGLGYCLSEEVRFRGGQVLSRNFDTYDIPRFSWIPEIEIALIDNPSLPPQGCGEPTITCMGGAIANGVHDATGIRMYELPMTPEKIRRALREKSASA